jgi:hypothetical protein
MEENKAILEEEISSRLLVTFLQEACKGEERRQKTSQKDGNSSTSNPLDMSSVLQHRFPRAYWDKAITYFSQAAT